jgi:hypothetical protein
MPNSGEPFCSSKTALTCSCDQHFLHGLFGMTQFISVQFGHIVLINVGCFFFNYVPRQISVIVGL